MDLLVELAVLLLIFVVSYGTAKRKKAKEKARKQPSAERQNNKREGTVFTHPYYESPKEKGMSLEDFRKKYADEISTAKEAAKKTASVMFDTEMPNNGIPQKKSNIPVEGNATEGRTVFSPQAEGRATEGKKSLGGSVADIMSDEGRQIEGRQTEGDFKKPVISKPQKKVEKAVAADNSVAALENGTVIGRKQVINHSLESGVDIAAFLAGKNLTPVQQGFIWAEIFGEPKAKKQKGYRF